MLPLQRFDLHHWAFDKGILVREGKRILGRGMGERAAETELSDWVSPCPAERVQSRNQW